MIYKLYNINKETIHEDCSNEKIYKFERIKTMKKLLSFTLVLVMALTFCSPVYAENNDGVLIATDFKDGKTQFIPLNLGASSSNIVTVDGDECLYIATMNTGANNWLAYPIEKMLPANKNYVIAFDVAVPQLADGTTSGTVKMYWSAIVQGAGEFASGEANRATISEVEVPVGSWKHVEMTFTHGLDFGSFGFSDWTNGDNKNVNADFYIDNLIVCEGSEYQDLKKDYTERSGKANPPDGYLVCDFSGVGVINRPNGDAAEVAGGYNYTTKDYDGNGCIQLKRKSGDNNLGWTDDQELTIPFNPISGKTYIMKFKLRYVGSDAAPNTKLDFYLLNGSSKQILGTSELQSKEWTEVTYEFKADGNYTSLAMLEQKINELNGFFQFDDLTITEKKASAETSDLAFSSIAVVVIAAAGICLSVKRRKKSA